jgi:membrane protease YdiL (CAAX protease family)
MESIQSARPNPIIQLAILFGLMGICLFMCLFLVKFLLPILFGVENADDFIVSIVAQKENINASLFMQSLASTWGMFLLPALLFTQVLKYDIGDFFRLNKVPKTANLLTAILVMLLGGIFINLLIDVMRALPLPEMLSHLRDNQKSTEDLINSVFAINTLRHFLVLTLVLALLPAVAEELFFRGVVQTLLIKSNMRPLVAVCIAAFSFSMMHLQFDNFLAILVMGIVLGLLYQYTQNLWIPIIAHFINNFSMIVFKYAYINGYLTTDLSDNSTFPLLLSGSAGVLMFLLINWLRKRSVALQSEY